MNWTNTTNVTHALLLLVGLSLVGAGCTTPPVKKTPRTIEAHAERDVAVVQTLNDDAGMITYVFYKCKKQDQTLSCTKACGDDYRCPEVPGLINASVSPEARGGMKAKDSSTESGMSGESTDTTTPGPMDKAKEGVTDGGDSSGDMDKGMDSSDDSSGDTENDGDSETDTDSKSDKDGADDQGGM
jgi:hypothetical protein